MAEAAPPPAPGPRPSADEVLTLIQRFNDMTQSMQASHDRLQRQVAVLQAELEEKNRELRRKNRLALLGEMAACLAHEIRNPLGGIELFADLLARDLPPASKPAEHVGKILSGLKRLNHLMDDYLSLSREGALVKSPGPLRPVVAEALAYARPALDEKSIAVEESWSAPAPVVPIDADRLQRVFLNIVLNAAQAMSPGGRLFVAAIEETDGGRPGVAVRVRDTGPGLSAEALAHLFSPYYTDKAKGTGLGLTIASRIVEGHGGALTARNPAEGGAEFRVWLPREEP